MESQVDTSSPRPVVMLAGTLEAVAAGARAPRPSGAWEVGHLLWTSWPAPTPGDLSWAEAWGLSAQTRFLYWVGAPAGTSALRQFMRPEPCEAGWGAPQVHHRLSLEPVPNAQRFVEALVWSLAGRGWSSGRDADAEGDKKPERIVFTHAETGARVLVDADVNRITLRWGSDEAPGEGAPPVGVRQGLGHLDGGGVSAQVDLPALAGLEAAMQAAGIARTCDALRGDAAEVRDEIISAQFDFAAACVQHWTTLAELSSAVGARWRPEGGLAVEVLLTPLGRRAWSAATHAVEAVGVVEPTWVRLAWAVDREAFNRADAALSGLLPTWAGLLEISGACALEPAVAQAVTALVAAPGILPGAAGALVGAMGGVDGAEISQVALGAALGTSAHRDRVWAEFKSNRTLVPSALWEARSSDVSGELSPPREAAVRVGDETLTVRERVASEGVWTAVASGEPVGQGTLGRPQPTDDPLGLRAAPVQWFELAVSPAELTRAAQRRGLGQAFPRLARAAQQTQSVTVTAIREDGRIVYRVDSRRVGSVRSEQ